MEISPFSFLESTASDAGIKSLHDHAHILASLSEHSYHFSSSGQAHCKEQDEAFLQKVRAFIEQRLPDNVRVGELSKALFFTRVQVFRKIKSLTGQSPSQYIRAIRLQKALDLLQATNLCVAEVAYSVGFDDPKYFTRVFSAAYGQSPSVFCKSVKTPEHLKM
jgi:AraC-like DNA-binding protein